MGIAGSRGLRGCQCREKGSWRLRGGGVSNRVIACAIAAAAYSGAVRGVGALGFGEEFFRVGFVVLVFGDALSASAVTGFAAVEIERAGVVFFRCGGDVRAGHETVYGPKFPWGLFWDSLLGTPFMCH